MAHPLRLLPRHSARALPALSRIPGPRSRRPLSSSPRAPYPRADAMDNGAINRESTEYSKSGTDDQAAGMAEAAFDPAKTGPEDMRGAAERGGQANSNPLDVSPANPEVSKQRGPTEGGPENSSGSSGGASERGRSSGAGSPPKGGKVG